MFKQRFLQHANFPHRSAYGSYDEEYIKLPRASNVGLAVGMVFVLAATVGVFVYYVL